MNNITNNSCLLFPAPFYVYLNLLRISFQFIQIFKIRRCILSLKILALRLIKAFHLSLNLMRLNTDTLKGIEEIRFLSEVD